MNFPCSIERVKKKLFAPPLETKLLVVFFQAPLHNTSQGRTFLAQQIPVRLISNLSIKESQYLIKEKRGEKNARDNRASLEKCTRFVANTSVKDKTKHLNNGLHPKK